jgi:hypothetical protein
MSESISMPLSYEFGILCMLYQQTIHRLVWTASSARSLGKDLRTLK